VDLRCRNELLELKVENTCEEDMGIPKIGIGGNGAGGGIGLENVRRRLDLIYNGRHILDIQKEGKHYSILLKIPVQ